MTEKLKPCPFCNGHAKMHCAKANASGTKLCYWIQCAFEGDIDCPCLPKTMIYDTSEEAIDAWNTRADNNEGN